MTKIDIFSGFLGAGKTTLIKKLIIDAHFRSYLVRKPDQEAIVRSEERRVGK